MTLLQQLRACSAFTFIILNTLLACVPLFFMAALRWLSPNAWRAGWNRQMDKIIDYWTGCNRWLIRSLGCCVIDVELEPGLALSRKRWYLLTCNHQSWSDILLLQNGFRPLLPPIKFFTKRELLWLPALGLAMWVLGFPYVRRPSREAIAANPALKDVDRAEVLRACADFRNNPVAVLNFTEGTRFTAAKHAAQQSPYQHLLKPKLGGVELVLNGLREELDGVLDITLHYEGPVPTFWEFLGGRCPAARVVARYRTVPETVRAALDEGNRTPLAGWIDELWRAKDAELASAAASIEHRPAPRSAA